MRSQIKFDKETHPQRLDRYPKSKVENGQALKVDNLRFAYNGRPTLNGINLAVHAGETVAVMGRNGAGKSTLLKCVMGLLAGEGEVAVNGRSTHNRHVADISREIAYLPQNPDDLLFAETVADELAITLRNHGMVSGIPIPDTRIENGSGIPIPEPPHNGIGALLGELGLAEMAGAYPRDLSVGQRQRTALGAVAITRPKLLLLDEPTRGLDYAAKQALVNIWKQWLADGMGLLLVTHDVELVAQIADRVLIMSQGEIIAKGQTADVLSASPLFAPQISRLFPNSGWLTVEDAMEGMQGSRGAATEGRLEQG
ncbi:MAG: ABC transporter ATP-binding protein [Chloroflexi bacterium]|nr:ABC transporter ATP-binding protein [Chloroflexota bacterium]